MAHVACGLSGDLHSSHSTFTGKKGSIPEQSSLEFQQAQRLRPLSDSPVFLSDRLDHALLCAGLPKARWQVRSRNDPDDDGKPSTPNTLSNKQINSKATTRSISPCRPTATRSWTSLSWARRERGEWNRSKSGNFCARSPPMACSFGYSPSSPTPTRTPTRTTISWSSKTRWPEDRLNWIR